MANTFSYADAVKLLGAKEHKLVTALDKIVGGALLGGATFGITELLSWFDAKVDLVSLSHRLLVKAGEVRQGISRHDRTERLQAAHAVIVVVAFFDVLKELKLPVKLKEIGLDDREAQLRLMDLTSLYDGTWLLPSPNRPYDENLTAVTDQYSQAGTAFLQLFDDLAVWDRLSEADRAQVTHLLGNIAPRAVRRYEELIGQLAGEYPELRFWLQMQQNASVRAGLARVETALADVLTGGKPDPRRSELSNRYRAMLSGPVIDLDEVPAGIVLPTTEKIYIDPSYQVSAMSSTARPAELSWWEKVLVRSDLHRYLVGYITSPKATVQPLIVLGDPGSGKSLLTKVLAARLPANDFVAVRVELRTVPTEADLVQQVEYGLRAALHEELSFAQLSRSAGDALPVVLLDGFDELLQATGVSQTNYLYNIQRFQRERAELGRPVVVVVTSRISVSSGMQIPQDADVLRLVPFTDEQVGRWLEVWNKSNAEYFRKNMLDPLEPKLALVHRDLAVQPLLLLMLALYDAADNSLLRDHESLGRVGLYERLLARFAHREVRKDDRDGLSLDLESNVEIEFERLSVVALAMFHRGSQWVSQKDIDDDLASLLEVQQPHRGSGMRTPLTPGAAVLGRFFFVQCATAQRDSQPLHTYEFLHSTFGEYLVARFIWCLLIELLPADPPRTRRRLNTYIHDDDLYAVLSLTPLTASRSVLDFLAEMAMSDVNRNVLIDVVTRLFEVAFEHRARSKEGYRPVHRPAPSKYAIYSLNLVLLSAVLDSAVETRSLGIHDWPRLTAFWKSQLSTGEWATLIQSLRALWLDASNVVVSIGDSWPPFVELKRLDQSLSLQDAARELNFTVDPAGNLFRYAFEALPDERFNVHYARALVDLTASPMDSDTRHQNYLRWADEFPDLVLDRLRRDTWVSVDTLQLLAAKTLGGSGAFLAQLCERIGRGLADGELLEVFAAAWKGMATSPRHEIPVLDAWLRLHEKGYEFPADRAYPDLAEVLHFVNLGAIGAVQPGLIRRARIAAQELGIIDD
ncbi:NACHT domain-containing protein [Actinocrispum wychmicini]|uniref:Dynein-related subfamily AAA family protein n=1 Tax=Actinocrispum wychmicini TaxID=1213861 RepID=A0A4R2IQ44_9PSEU|nr:AAA family ATPase [Actinocrispum wychmicini]TCO46446.1 dynein-related subfamily AAA family protein [Actinocrispum wychmicini]